MVDDSASSTPFLDFTPAVVDEAVAAWSHSNGLTTVNDSASVPASLLMRRARSALSSAQRVLKSPRNVSMVEFAVVWYLLRPMLVRSRLVVTVEST